MSEGTENPERRLAAILFADVVGYSRLMGVDEAATLAAWQQVQFAVVNPSIGAHQGRVVKQLGDGVFVEFQSVVQAVACAVAMQRGIAQRRAGLGAASEPLIQLRIGVNLGDVLVQGGDVFGDGVNIAARLQTLAVPDGICISNAVFGHIDGAMAHDFVDSGAHQFKNIDRAIRVYRSGPSGDAALEKKAFRPFIDLPVEEAPQATGGCLCGQVRFEVTEKALGSMLCHCRMCQRFSGAPMLEGTTFAASAFRLTKGKVKIYQSSLIAERGFCGKCGSPILYQGRVGYWTQWIVVTTGSFDTPERFPPTYHLGTESMLGWLKVADDLPRTACQDSPSLVEAYHAVGQEVP